MDKQRYGYIDIAKALGMLCVIWGHVIVDGSSHLFVYAFHMPLFFFLSGWVFDSKRYPTLRSLLQRKFKTLIMPYILFSLITWIVWASYNFVRGNAVDSYINPLLQTFIAQGSSEYLKHNAPLWFVTCLLFTETLYYYISKLPKSINVIICCCCAIVGYIMIQPNAYFDFTKLPWGIESALSSVVFYSAGNLIREKYSCKINCIVKNKAIYIPIICILALITWFGAIANGRVSMGSNVLGNNVVLFYLLAFTGVIFVLLCSVFVDALLCSGRKSDNIYIYIYIYKPMIFVGKHSFEYMAIHYPIKDYLLKLCGGITGISVKVLARNPIYGIIGTIIVLAITTSIVIGMEKAKQQFARRHDLRKNTAIG